jgi:Fe2+ or Zn2+ uptake regulation protein
MTAMAEPNPIVVALDQAGYRITAPRRAVANLIAEHGGHFTASELEAHAGDRRLVVRRATGCRARALLSERRVGARLALRQRERREAHPHR